MSHQPYSVLMSIYKKERPEWLRVALDSMLAQTVPPAEIVMVKDGSLTSDLEAVLEQYGARHPGLFKFVSYPENRGLGYALSLGVAACSNEIIARMDTDDYSRPDRIEKQLTAMQRSGLDMVGSQVIEFIDEPDKPIAVTNLPEDHQHIVSYSKRRNPFRHPPMIYKRSKVIAAGSYNGDYPFFEDWDIFNRMLAQGCIAANIHEPLVAMRVSKDFYARRGGITYLKYAWRFEKAQVDRGFFTPFDCVRSFVPRAVVCLMPNAFRGAIYSKLLRKKG